MKSFTCALAQRSWVAIVLTALLSLAGCAGRPPAPVAPAPVEAPRPSPAPAPAPAGIDFENLPPTGAGVSTPRPNHVVVPVWFATDRARRETAPPDPVPFGAGRGELSYGQVQVSIPHGHQPGALESPSWLRLEFRENPDRHVVLLATELFANDAAFYDALAGRLGRSATGHALVFVHGYNVSFADAARRTAQIAHDIGYGGVPTFFSWPSQAEVKGYTVDEQMIEWAQPHLARFLEDMLTRSGARQLHLIAHSMGNRGVTRALVSLLARRPELRERVAELILAAPDIDAEVFRRDIAPALARAQQPLTLYASSADVALSASKAVHGGYPRAGDSGQALLLMPGVETIDATAVDTSLLGHSYIGQSGSVLTDLAGLIGRRLRPDARPGLKPVQTSTGRYWEVVPAASASASAAGR